MLSENFITDMVAIAKKAGLAIMTEYQKPPTIMTKPDDSPVTPADLASHEIFATALGKDYSSIPLVSEEDFSPDTYPPKNQGGYFLLDPLDGTKEFIKKSGEFAINLGWVQNQQPIFGLLFHPPTMTGYVGAVGQGVWHIRGDSLTLIKKPKTDDTIKIVMSPSDKKPERFEKMLGQKIDKICYRGSSLKFFSLLEGDANYYPRTAPCYDWDIAAGHALITTLGGRLKIYDHENYILTDKELTYGHQGAKAKKFLCWL